MQPIFFLTGINFENLDFCKLLYLILKSQPLLGSTKKMKVCGHNVIRKSNWTECYLKREKWQILPFP